MSADEGLQSGDRVGDYEVVREIGRGGFGTVYEVVHPALGKRAAAKVLNRERAVRPDVIRRFLQEAQAGAKLEHPGIVDVFAYGQLPDGRPYFVMELLTGETLAELLDERGYLELAEALPILEGVAAALDAAHAHGIAHRDLKPANVFLDDRSGPKLLDFGVARLLDGGGSPTTDDTAIIGTPHYMSPEQSRGRAVDTRTDLYALGVLCFRVLTGEHPFDADDPVGILVQHAAHAPPVPSSVRHVLSPAVDRAVLAMLEKDPAQRPSSARAAVRALTAASGVGLGRQRWIALALLLAAITLALLVGRDPSARASRAATFTDASVRAVASWSEPPAPPATPFASEAPTPAVSPPRPRAPYAPRAPDPEAIEDPFRR